MAGVGLGPPRRPRDPGQEQMAVSWLRGRSPESKPRQVFTANVRPPQLEGAGHPWALRVRKGHHPTPLLGSASEHVQVTSQHVCTPQMRKPKRPHEGSVGTHGRPPLLPGSLLRGASRPQP